MNSKIKSGLRTTARRLWLYYSEERKLCIANSKNGKLYKCNICKICYKLKEMAVDHLIPCGKFNSFIGFGYWLERLFCSVDNLQLVCHQCHAEKTIIDKREMNGN